ncbi:response regulator [cf. Phormidesmis sp. LEGE 11477]|uniref:response regulator n=1 Tax=cf. Phormidesmis sp. LEGE 11477 TaxID=1828680 RepID=UPI0018801F5B|nr:response regulator [cf. Phormidesmis sp. LEGE 11477]MBE9061870.1 response regulator [cf. Phormidesmis sp. LEGE 11477]
MAVRERNRRQKAAKHKILVVDDEPDNLDLLYRTFYRDFKVIKANSGPDALEILAEQGDIAVIISDQRMPGMSGTELLRLTADRYPNSIRIVLTGYTDVEDLVDAINEGKVFKYVTKPWEESDLRMVVNQAVDTHSVLQARTQELNRVVRQETLLNAITNTIRSAQSSEEMLKTIVETLGEAFELDYGIVYPLTDAELNSPMFHYVGTDAPAGVLETVPGRDLTAVALEQLKQTVWETILTQHLESEEDIVAAAPKPENVAAYTALDICTSLLIPLACKQDVLAILALHKCSHQKPWQESEIKLLTTLADQAALALSQTWTYERVESLAQRELLINTITQALHASLEPSEIFAAITQKLGQALKADSCTLSLWKDDDYAQCVGRYDLHMEMAPTLPEPKIAIAKDSILAEMQATKRPIVISTAELANHHLAGGSFGTRALMGVPLLAESKITGCIMLRQMGEDRAWTTEEVNLAQAVANQAAIAVQQANLYQTSKRQAEQLLELDQQKNAFFQNISHEFRTPLTLTIGPLESAVERGEGLDAEQATIALRNSRRLLRLVNQLLDLQKLDAGKMKPTFRPCDLAAFTIEVVEAFQNYCERKQIQLNTEISPCSTVYLDMEKFDKVLYNLLSNAMKFTPKGKSITVRLKEASGQAHLQVRDQGIGIREDQIPHLFERFRQADGSANRHYEGTGLGLSLVQELTQLHGGEILVESVYGEGTTFTINLPLGADHLPSDQVIDQALSTEKGRAAVELSDIEMASATADSAIALPPAVEGTQTERASFKDAQILVVDDNPDLRAYVSSVLKRQGYQVQTAEQGAAGLEMAMAHKPDLIITDLMMPGVNGLEMIERIRQDTALQGTPIILLTAKVDNETRLEGVEQGADAYLSKPFNDRELLAEVRNLLALKSNERKVAELNQYLTESVLQRFLPPSLVKKANEGNLRLDLRPEPRLVTILFSDIVGFTQLSNTLRSRRVAELLNQYLETMTHAIFNHGGTVDKFMGDAVLALFGAPEEMSPNEQVRRAIAAARQMYKDLEGLNHEWAEQGIGPVKFRCGIHQGTAVVGMFGSVERSDYTAIGPSVNIAARIQEAATAETILVSAAVADYLDDQEIVKFDPLKLKGVDETVLTFGVKTQLEV